MEKVEILLKEFGLTDYESKAYITLLKLGTATAEQISEFGKIPLPRVYDTLVELNKKGLVFVSKGRPKKFKLTPHQKALNNLIEIRKRDFENNVKILKDKIKSISLELSKIKTIKTKEEKFNIWFIERRKNVVKTLNEQLDSARKNVLNFAGDLSWINDIETLKTVRSTMKRGVKIKILARGTNGSKEFNRNLKKTKKLGLNVKTGYLGSLRGYIIDNKIASIAIKSSREGVNVAEEGMPKSDIERKYELIIIEHPVIVKALKENFDFWWRKLK